MKSSIQKLLKKSEENPKKWDKAENKRKLARKYRALKKNERNIQ